ncbi:hypothetical protein [Levilactobacillus brevis]|uniref:hypothetical protein n=1 Tax=Levilactobacillus brevis TaxID=1580 RepID=UPI0021A830DF|nr:hypothetical protein [Levilactobacillus brevis]MCT3573256.1 hypothetical protein [Levilactobacillus brevis]
MRFKKIWLLLLGLLIVAGGGQSVVALADVQQSTYQVELTPSKDASSAIAGGDGDSVTGDSGDHGGSPATKSPSGNRVTPTAAQGQDGDQVPGTPMRSGLSGRLPQLSEGQWYGFGSMAGIIVLLLIWIGMLLKRRKQEN